MCTHVHIESPPRQPPGNKVCPSRAPGPGSELRKMLAWFARPSDTCNCETRAETMNDWGVVNQNGVGHLFLAPILTPLFDPRQHRPRDRVGKIARQRAGDRIGHIAEDTDGRTDAPNGKPQSTKTVSDTFSSPRTPFPAPHETAPRLQDYALVSHLLSLPRSLLQRLWMTLTS
jgi:hypothetical protein